MIHGPIKVSIRTGDDEIVRGYLLPIGQADPTSEDIPIAQVALDCLHNCPEAFPLFKEMLQRICATPTKALVGVAPTEWQDRKPPNRN